MDVSLRLIILPWLYLGAAGDFDGGWPRQVLSTTGLCRFGSRVDCCWGWVRHSWGQCQPICQPGCKHGECVGPNKCKCHPGYTGKTCNQAEHLYATSHDWPSEPPFFNPLDHRAANFPWRGEENPLLQVVHSFHLHGFKPKVKALANMLKG